jgi:hypothetical protein
MWDKVKDFWEWAIVQIKGKRIWCVVALICILFVVIMWILLSAYQNQASQEAITLHSQYDNAVSSNMSANVTIDLYGKWQLRENEWAVFWSFCGTDTFKTVAVSILIPLVLATLGGIFKINNILETRVREQRQKRINDQTQCIKETAEMWNSLYGIVSKIRFYKKEEEGKGKIPTSPPPKTQDKQGNITDETAATTKPKTIEELLEDIENFASKAEEVVNQWHFAFPMLPKIAEKSNIVYMEKDELKRLPKKEREELYQQLRAYRRPSEMILFFINIQYEAASSVAFYIKAKIKKNTKDNAKNKNNDAIIKLQNALGVVQDITKDMVHQYMLAILKCAVEPQEGYDDKEQMDINKKNINKYIQGLFEYYLNVKKTIYDIKLLPLVNEVNCNEKGKDFQQKQNNILKPPEEHPNSKKIVLKNDKNKKDEDSMIKQTCSQLVSVLKEIDDCDIAKYWEYKYSDVTLLDLAKRLCCVSINEYIEDKIKWRIMYKRLSVKLPVKNN